MPRPTRGYQVASGEEVPGVTTIIKRFDDKSRLIAWANKQGLQGVSINDIRAAAFKDGKEIHHIFENVIKRREVEVKPEYQGFVDKLKKFLKSLEIVDVLSEIGLVSENHKFGGTPDLIVKTKPGETIVIDFKFANTIAVAVAYQMGAYKILVEENMLRPVERGIVIHLEKRELKKKDNPTCVLTTLEVSPLVPYADAFLEMRKMYPTLQERENAFNSSKENKG